MRPVDRPRAVPNRLRFQWFRPWHTPCSPPAPVSDQPRIIVALANAVERAQVAEWLHEEHLEPVPVASAGAALGTMRARPFDLLITEDAFATRDGLRPAAGRVRSPLTPTILVGSQSGDGHGDAVDCQTMYLARPLDRATVICFVSMALMESRPTRRSVRKAVNRFDVFANGVPSRLIDVSNEGLRVELASTGRTPLPIYFKVRVPLMGVGVVVKRMWTGPSVRPAATWYGVALAENPPRAEQAWRSFVEIVPELKAGA
jgi:hypothetical protein